MTIQKAPRVENGLLLLLGVVWTAWLLLGADQNQELEEPCFSTLVLYHVKRHEERYLDILPEGFFFPFLPIAEKCKKVQLNSMSPAMSGSLLSRLYIWNWKPVMRAPWCRISLGDTDALDSVAVPGANRDSSVTCARVEKI